jgi:hypothetical protein
MLKAGLYEEAAEELENALTAFGFRSAIEDKYGDHVFEGKDIAGAIRLIPRIANGPIITTNFDRIIERAFAGEACPFESIVSGAKPDMINRAIQQDRRRLIKLHGDWEEGTDRILTKTEYQKHYGSDDGQAVDLTQPLPRMLKLLLTGRSLLFLGCSLNQDRTVRVLEKVVLESHEIEHYAILELPSTVGQRREKNKFLAKHNVRPIWYPTRQHVFVEKILLTLIDEKDKVAGTGRGMKAKLLSTGSPKTNNQS